MRDSDPVARRLSKVGLVSELMGAFRLRSLAAILAVALGAFAVAPAQAHGRLGAAEGRCRLFIGPDIMNFTGYLPEASKNEFCEDIPSTGPMIMVLDAEQEELRDMKVELRIIKDTGNAEAENENLEALTVAYRGPRVYPTGTINFEHTFNDPGYFVGIVTVIGDHGERWVSRFPFSVAKTFMRDLPVYITLALGVMASVAIYLVHRRRSPPPQIATAAAAFKQPKDPGFDDRDGGAPPSARDDSAEAGETDAPTAQTKPDEDSAESYKTAAE